MDFDWDAVQIARLTCLWDEGHSTAEIGRRMGATKNAICGKADRLNLPPRPSPIKNCVNVRQLNRAERRERRQAEDAAKAAVPKALAVKPTFAAPVVPQSPARPVRPVVAEGCCWPMGKRLVCEAPALFRKPYCFRHQRESVADKSKYSDEAAFVAGSDRTVSADGVISRDIGAPGTSRQHDGIRHLPEIVDRNDQTLRGSQ